MPRAWISLGSNIEPRANLRAALKLLESRFGSLVVSPVYRSPAEGFEGDDFLNLVVGIDTGQSLPEVRAALREIENARGRVRGAEKFSARTLDLDLLTWGELVDADRNLPRDEILEYAFVLRPLADVAPDERHPVTGKSYAELWRDFPRKGRLQRVSL